MTDWQQGIPCSSTSGHIGRHFWMQQRKLIPSGRLESQFRRGVGRCHKGIRGSELEEIRQFSYIIGYTDITFTPYSAEAHNALPLRSARRRGGRSEWESSEVRGGEYIYPQRSCRLSVVLEESK